jgi:hypothetical protein
MDHAGGDEAYAFIADLYDHVVPYRERHDVAFLWKHLKHQADLFWRSVVEPGAY